MKYLELVVVLVIASISFVSCTNDEAGDMYSNRGVEADKAILNLSMQKVDEEILQLGQTDFAQISHSMSQQLNGQVLEGNGRFVEKVIKVGELMYQAECSDCCFEELIDLSFASSYYCQPLLDEGYGVWNWDQETGMFLKDEEHDSEYIFRFPVERDATADTAVLVIYDIVVYDGQFPDKGNDLEDGTKVEKIIEKLNFNLKWGDQLALSGNIQANFSEAGYYEDLALTFNPQPYNLSYDLGKSESIGYWFSSFGRDSYAIIDEIMELEIDESQVDMPVSSVVNESFIHDIVIETRTLTGYLYNELLKLDALDEGSEQYARDYAAALNSHALMTVKYADDRSIIAEVEAVPKRDDEENTWWVDLELEFNDGSRVSCDEYFTNFLTEFKVNLEELVNQFENKFGI